MTRRRTDTAGSTGARTLVSVAALAAMGLMLALDASPAPALSTTPGTKRILVIPVEFPSCNGCKVSPGDQRFCPNVNLPCYPGPYYFGPPRHTPSQLQSFLNAQVSGFWSATTYGLESMQFFVLTNPATTDGWFPAPAAYQYYATESPYSLTAKEQSKGYRAYGPDVIAASVHALCTIPLYAAQLGCGFGPNTFPHRYDGLILLNNWQDFGGATKGGPFSMWWPSFGAWAPTVTATNESLGDQTLALTIEHELGHQFGTLSHYGDCQSYPPPFIGGTGLTKLDCLGGNPGPWDVMSYTMCSGVPYNSESCRAETQMGAYSRIAAGWLSSSDVVEHDIFAEGPFADFVSLGPLSLPPGLSGPNAVRLSMVPFDFPRKLEFDIECRERTNGDDGIPSEGVVITSVHEYSYDDFFHRAPAVHVVRPVTPFDTIASAMQPGDVWTDPSIDLSVRFEGFTADDRITPARRCDVSIAHGVPLPASGWMGFAPSRTGSSGASAFDPRFSPDLGMNVGHLPPTHVAGGGDSAQLPVDPPWGGHDNLLVARMRNFDLVPATGVQATMQASRGVVTNWCGTTPPGTPLPIGTIDARSDATGVAHWFGRGKVGPIVLTAMGSTDDGRRSYAQSGFAFQFHAKPGKTLTTMFSVAASPSCPAPEFIEVSPQVAPDGWTVAISPHAATLAPGKAVKFKVKVTAPVGSAPGTGVDIPLDVLHGVEFEPADGLPSDCPVGSPPVCGQPHMVPFGTMDVLARVVGAPAFASLTCPAAGHDLSADVAVTAPGGNVLVEFTSPKGARTTVAATYDAFSGLWHASLTPNVPGRWKMTARWGGDPSHAPVQSKRCMTTVA